MFVSREVVSDEKMARLTSARVTDPELAMRQAAMRVRPNHLTRDGKLTILAADHPARRVIKVGDDAVGMANRQDYLARILRVLSSDQVDGLMSTMDVLEDLLVLDHFLQEIGGPPVLDHKVLIASLNRGGLAGSSWELDDPITGPTPETCAAWRLDGAKILLRIADEDNGSLKTMLASARVITEANALHLPTFLEPLLVVRKGTDWAVQKDPVALAKIAGVASALGDSSRYLWLKLPYCDKFEMVARSTSLPILMLGGESAGSPAPFLTELASGMSAGSNVRGALVGRNVLYPGPDVDPKAMADAVGGIVHEGWSVNQALERVS